MTLLRLGLPKSGDLPPRPRRATAAAAAAKPPRRRPAAATAAAAAAAAAAAPAPPPLPLPPAAPPAPPLRPAARTRRPALVMPSSLTPPPPTAAAQQQHAAAGAGAPSWAVPGTLLRALLEPDLHVALTPAALLQCDNHELFSLLPLALAAVQRIGETPGQRALFVSLVDALRSRVTACRAVKLRLLLVAQTDGYRAFWNAKLVHRNEAYPAAWAHLRALVENVLDEGAGAPSPHAFASSTSTVSSSSSQPSQQTPSSATDSLTPQATVSPGGSSMAIEEQPSLHRGGSSSIHSTSNVSRDVAKWQTDKYALRRFAYKHLFHPTEGVQMRDYVRSLRSYRNCFKASELVDIIVEYANFSNRADAVAIGQKLLDDKMIIRIGKRDKPFEDSDTMYQSTVANHARDALHAHIKTETGDVRCWKAFQCEKEQASLKNVELKVACDMIDLQSLDFWREAVFLPSPSKGQSLGFRMISHPLMYCRFTEAAIPATVGHDATQDLGTAESPPDDSDVGSSINPTLSQSTFSDDETMSELPADITLSPGVVGNVVVRKVFSSIARPMILELRRPIEETFIEDDGNHEVVTPHVLVKMGDNLGQDMCVEIMFRCFNMIWEYSPELFPDPKQVPFAFAYEVFPTGVKRGFMEAVPGLESLKGFDWEAWKERAKDPVVLNRMIMSAAGSYVGAYILGAADRHQDNVQIQDGLTMLHIDFGFLLGATPPIDGPRFAIYPEMENAFRDAEAWDLFVDACENAFLAVRRVAPAVLRTCVMLFTKFGFSENAIRAFLTGKFSLNTHEQLEKVAGALVRNQVKHSSTDWKTRFKAYSHNHVDPTFYSLLERRFPPAVLAMKIVDAKEQRLSKRMSAALSKKTEPEAHEKVEL